MDYQAPRNYPATVGNPRPSYPDGDKPSGTKGAIPTGKALEHPMREIINCIEQSGQTPNANDLTQLWKAIQAAVAAGGGSGGSPPALDFTKMPVFPEVTSNGGLFLITPFTGQVVVANGTTFVHRGGNGFTSDAVALASRTFTTLANKTYHLRWRFNGGAPLYELKDLSDGVYNPGALAEADAAFDTTFDSILIARVVTDSANTPTVTALYNKASLAQQAVVSATGVTIIVNDVARADVQSVFNWARVPRNFSLTLVNQNQVSQEAVRLQRNVRPLGASSSDLMTAGAQFDVNRYRIAQSVLLDEVSAAQFHFNARA